MARTITLLPLDLPRRFAAAAGYEPLSALSPRDRGELEALLAAGARELEDLPGRWQAALLASESAAAGMTEAFIGSCCGGGTRGDRRARVEAPASAWKAMAAAAAEGSTGWE